MTDASAVQPADPADNPVTDPKSPPRWPLFLLIVAGIAVPALFFYQTSFATHLSDEKLLAYLNPEEKPRHIQHALEQLSRRIENDGVAAERFYPPALALLEHPEPVVRATLAWLMGRDNRHAPFHEALLTLVQDAEFIVRENAALSLARFGDDSGRATLVEMLSPLPVFFTQSGVVKSILGADELVDRHSRLAVVTGADGQESVVMAPVDGAVQSVSGRAGKTVKPGDPLCFIKPEPAQVLGALQGLYLVGCDEDLPAIERYRAMPDYSDQIHAQARLTAEAARTRKKVLPRYDAVGDFRFAESSGREIALEDLKGKIWIADFFFTECAGICLAMTARMAELQTEFKGLDDVKLVSFSVDPERDSLEALAQYAEKYHADRNQWFFLRADKPKIADLCQRSFKVVLQDQPVGPDGKIDIMHSPHFVLVDRKGCIRGYYRGTEEDPVKQLIRDARRLLAEPENPRQ